ncbi:MAG TPA: hypothetical protein VIG99_08040 [Myxococcaceae bacterium]|jgi:hypothetical protein
MANESWWDFSRVLAQMDWMLWVLAAFTVTSAVFCGMAISARMTRRGSWRVGAVAALVAGVVIAGWAVVSYFYGASEVAKALELVNAVDRAQIESIARSELSQRFAFSIVASMPALALGIGLLGTGGRVRAVAR